MYSNETDRAAQPWLVGRCRKQQGLKPQNTALAPFSWFQNKGRHKNRRQKNQSRASPSTCRAKAREAHEAFARASARKQPVPSKPPPASQGYWERDSPRPSEEAAIRQKTLQAVKRGEELALPTEEVGEWLLAGTTEL